MTRITYLVRTPVIRGTALKGAVPPYHLSHGGTTPLRTTSYHPYHYPLRGGAEP